MRSGGRSARAPSGWIAAALLTSAINSRRLTILSRSLTNQKSLAHIGAALALRCCPLPSCAARIRFFGFSKAGRMSALRRFCSLMSQGHQLGSEGDVVGGLCSLRAQAALDVAIWV